MGNVAELETRRARGKALRQQVPRREHEAIGKIHRDPIKLLEAGSHGRVGRLIPLRYGRMIASPFAFYRGSAIIQAHDLSGTVNSGLTMQICGDCHLANFGGFATPERALLFDLNDFDETSPGPWEWDLKRLAASFVVGARHLRHSAATADNFVYELVNSYRDRMAVYAEMGILETWYDRITFDRMLAEATNPIAQKRIRRAMEQAATRTHESLLPKLTEREGDKWRILDAPPAVFHVRGKQTLFDARDDWMRTSKPEEIVAKCFKEYLSTLAQDRRLLLSHFKSQDIAFKVVGVGSVGTRCLIQLLIDSHGKPLFLQIKEATRSVVARYFKTPPVAHEGRRVVEGQRLMQAASDLFLGWTKGPFGRHFYLRQLRDMKFSADVELMDAEVLTGYARLCGRVLARAHAKGSGLAAEVSGYLGASDRMAEALIAYSNAYADQVERDYEIFVAACRSGRLEARTDADLAADFRV
ncbi:Uncharacterized conserved protein, DUF2252 family [Cupriavidus sp. YR651]|nr:DUF2252 domain-containing protein [Cupriavidus sp. YR651]SDD28199.1 Uncharacterized conserved protein, DUF2252 family [Cupriavidus sp. YR651]